MHSIAPFVHTRTPAPHAPGNQRGVLVHEAGICRLIAVREPACVIPAQRVTRQQLLPIEPEATRHLDGTPGAGKHSVQ